MIKEYELHFSSPCKEGLSWNKKTLAKLEKEAIPSQHPSE